MSKRLSEARDLARRYGWGACDLLLPYVEWQEPGDRAALARMARDSARMSFHNREGDVPPEAEPGFLEGVADAIRYRLGEPIPDRDGNKAEKRELFRFAVKVVDLTK